MMNVAAKTVGNNPTNCAKRRVTNPRALLEPRRSFVINKGRSVEASYVKPEVPEWSENPLIAALPPALDVPVAAARLWGEPAYDKKVLCEPGYIRRLVLQQAMKFLFIPLDIHLDLHQRLQCSLRVGYADRNPVHIDYANRLAASIDAYDQYSDSNANSVHRSATTASGFNILGMSGVGKSRAILNCLELLPQTISHAHFRGQNFTCKQLVWLKQDCPFDGNPKGLCIDFFNMVDAILGTSYRQNYAGGRRLIDEMLSDMARVAANHSLGAYVVDEIQRLSLAKSGGADRMLNFFVQLVNTIGVPVILVGTYKAMPLFQGEFSQMRRGTGQGDIIWDRLENDEQWHHFVESLWRYQYVRKVSNPDERFKGESTLSDVLYDESQGIVDFAIKLFMFAQERAIETEHERIDPGIIRKVAKDKLKIPRPVLRALRLRDTRVLEKFEDLYPSAMKDYLVEQILEPQVSGKLCSSPEINALLNEYSDSKTIRTPREVRGIDPEVAVTGE